MVGQFNYVTCPKCGHDRNPLTASKCEICGHRLKGFSVPPIAWILGGLALAGAGYFGYREFVAPKLTPVVIQPTPTATTGTNPSTPPPISGSDATPYLSRGEKVLFKDIDIPGKQAATTAIASGDVATAITQLESARLSTRMDPETLIYLNNARIANNTAAPVIAAVVPISSSPSSAREILRGIAQAQDQAIKTGSPLKVVIADDNNDPTQAASIAQALVKDTSIVAVIGHGTSKTSLAAAPIYQQNQLVMIAPTSTSTELSQVPKGSGGNFIFRTIASDQFTGTALARRLLASGKKKAAVFYNANSSYSKSLQQAFATTLSLEGGEMLQQVDLSQPNPAGQLAGSAADSVVLLADSDTLTAALDVARANANRLPLFSGDAMYRIETLKQGGSAVNSMVLPVAWHPLKSADPSFAQTGSTLWGGDVNWRTAMGYDAVQTIQAARSNGSISRVALGQALAKSGFMAKGVTGSVSFLPSGDRNITVVLVKVQPGSRSGTGYDFVPLQ